MRVSMPVKERSVRERSPKTFNGAKIFKDWWWSEFVVTMSRKRNQLTLLFEYSWLIGIFLAIDSYIYWLIFNLVSFLTLLFFPIALRLPLSWKVSMQILWLLRSFLYEVWAILFHLSHTFFLYIFFDIHVFGDFDKSIISSLREFLSSMKKFMPVQIICFGIALSAYLWLSFLHYVRQHVVGKLPIRKLLNRQNPKIWDTDINLLGMFEL